MIMFCTLRALLINMRHCHFCLHIDQLAPLIFAYFQLDNWSRNSTVFILGARCPLYSCQHCRAFYWQLINWPRGYTQLFQLVLQTINWRSCTITEKAPTRAFSWLKAATTAFTFRTLLRHYAKWALTPRSLNVKLGPQRKGHKGRAVWLA